MFARLCSRAPGVLRRGCGGYVGSRNQESFFSRVRWLAVRSVDSIDVTKSTSEQLSQDSLELRKERQRATARAYYAKNREAILQKNRVKRIWKTIEKNVARTPYGIQHIISFFRYKKVVELEVYKMASISVMADYWVVVTVPSAKAMVALSRNLYKEARASGMAHDKPSALMVDGSREDRDWTVVDLGSVWVHLFTAEEGAKMRDRLKHEHADRRVLFDQYASLVDLQDSDEIFFVEQNSHSDNVHEVLSSDSDDDDIMSSSDLEGSDLDWIRSSPGLSVEQNSPSDGELDDGDGMTTSDYSSDLVGVDQRDLA